MWVLSSRNQPWSKISFPDSPIIPTNCLVRTASHHLSNLASICHCRGQELHSLNFLRLLRIAGARAQLFFAFLLRRVEIMKNREYLPTLQPDIPLMVPPSSSPDHHRRTARLLPAFKGRQPHWSVGKGSMDEYKFPRTTTFTTSSLAHGTPAPTVFLNRAPRRPGF